MGIYSTKWAFGAFAGGLLGGWSLQQFGIDGLFMVLALILAVCVVLQWVCSHRKHCRRWF